MYSKTSVCRVELRYFELLVLWNNGKRLGHNQCKYIQTQLCFIEPAYIEVSLLSNAGSVCIEQWASRHNYWSYRTTSACCTMSWPTSYWPNVVGSGVTTLEAPGANITSVPLPEEKGVNNACHNYTKLCNLKKLIITAFYDRSQIKVLPILQFE